MIKTGIIGADTLPAAELLRILVNHPEVDITLLYAPELTGRQVSSVHHGFIGEDIINFSNMADPSALDVIFITDDSEYGRNLIDNRQKFPETRIIDLSPGRFQNWSSLDMEYGLSELNRKSLVRGAKYAIIPTEVASLSLIGFSPLANYLLLGGDLTIEVAAPADLVDTIDTVALGDEIERQLRNLQTSFTGKVRIKIEPNKSQRVMRIRGLIGCNLSLEEISKIYENIYDDHNFTFMSYSPVEGREVEGTQKCIISYRKPDASTLEIEVIGDCRLRGGAGDAVHVLNLLFSLHEKTGLYLKPSRYGHTRESTSRSLSWFA